MKDIMINKKENYICGYRSMCIYSKIIKKNEICIHTNMSLRWLSQNGTANSKVMDMLKINKFQPGSLWRLCQCTHPQYRLSMFSSQPHSLMATFESWAVWIKIILLIIKMLVLK